MALAPRAATGMIVVWAVAPHYRAGHALLSFRHTVQGAGEHVAALWSRGHVGRAQMTLL